MKGFVVVYHYTLLCSSCILYILSLFLYNTVSIAGYNLVNMNEVTGKGATIHRKWTVAAIYLDRKGQNNFNVTDSFKLVLNVTFSIAQYLHEHADVSGTDCVLAQSLEKALKTSPPSLSCFHPLHQSHLYLHIALICKQTALGFTVSYVWCDSWYSQHLRYIFNLVCLNTLPLCEIMKISMKLFSLVSYWLFAELPEAAAQPLWTLTEPYPPLLHSTNLTAGRTS